MNKELKTWHFGINNDELVDLVLKGKKTATTSIYNRKIDKVGTESVLIYQSKKPACITKVVKNVVKEFKNIDWDIAKLEGENTNLDDWRKKHIEFFKSIDDNFTEESRVVVEIFDVVKKFKNNDYI